jgi:hypothetical protein
VAATLVLLPELHEPHRFGSFAPIYEQVGRIAREAGFEVIDPSGAFPPGPGDAFWVTPEDAHPNAAAQALFAEAVAGSRYACEPETPSAPGVVRAYEPPSPAITPAMASAAQR